MEPVSVVLVNHNGITYRVVKEEHKCCVGCDLIDTCDDDTAPFLFGKPICIQLKCIFKEVVV